MYSYFDFTFIFLGSAIFFVGQIIYFIINEEEYDW